MNIGVPLHDGIFVQFIATVMACVMTRMVNSMTVGFRAVEVHSIMLGRLMLRECSRDVLRVVDEKFSFFEFNTLIGRDIVLVSHSEDGVVGLVTVVSFVGDVPWRMDTSWVYKLGHQLTVSFDYNTFERTTSSILSMG